MRLKMESRFYFIGEYKGKSVYYSQKHGLALEKKLDLLIEPKGLEKVTILAKFGGIVGIEMIVENFKKREKEYKKEGD